MGKPGSATCAVESCARRHRALGYCIAHYTRVRRHGTPLAHVPISDGRDTAPGELCSVEACDRIATCKSWCSGHYQRWRTYGTPGTTPITRPTPLDATCQQSGCECRQYAKLLCRYHYERQRRGGAR